METSSQCSRELSRRARAAVESKLLAPFGLVAADLPESCPLHPASDLYLYQESQKTEVRSTLWKCGLCGKHFKSEVRVCLLWGHGAHATRPPAKRSHRAPPQYYLDRHLERHHDDAYLDGATYCPAALCDVIGCEVTEEFDTLRLLERSGQHFSTVGVGGRRGPAFVAPSAVPARASSGAQAAVDLRAVLPCSGADAERMQLRCQSLFHRCFPASTDATVDPDGGNGLDPLVADGASRP